MEMSDITCIRKGVASKYHRRLEICKEENSQNRASKKLTMGFSQLVVVPGFLLVCGF